MYKCKYCKKEFESQSGWHIIYCEKNPNGKKLIRRRARNNTKKRVHLTLICKICKNVFKQTIIDSEYGWKCVRKTCSLSCSGKCSNKKKKERIIIQKKCEKCKNIFEQEIIKNNTLKKRFCSKRCANSRPHSDEWNENIRDGVKKWWNYPEKTGYEKYRDDCKFKFNVYDYPEHFDLSLIEKYGWYTAKNRGNNYMGISRDHMYSIRKGWENKILSEIISHPVNCKLIQNVDNVKKNRNCSITTNELKNKIKDFNKKYNF